MENKTDKVESNLLPADSTRKPRRGLRRLAPAALIFIGLLGAAYYMILKLQTGGELPQFERSLLQRQIAALRDYESRQKSEGFLSPNAAVIAIREQFLQEVIRRSLPLRQVFEETYVARLDSARVHLEDGVAVVNLAGRGMLASQEDSPLYVDLLLQGLFSISEIDHKNGILQANLVITDVKVNRAGPDGAGNFLHPVARYFSRLQVEDWNRLGQQIHLPLKVGQEIIFPAVEGDVDLPESRIPISVRVAAITTLERRMVLSLTLLPDSAYGEFLVPVPAKARAESTRIEPPQERPAAESLLSSQDNDESNQRWWRKNTPAAQQGNLRRRVLARAKQDSLWQGVMASDHDLIMIVPESVLKTLVARVARRYLGGVTLDLKPEVDAPVDEALKIKVLGRKINMGRIRGRIHLARLRGEFKIAGVPRVVLAPPDELVFTVPAFVLGGGGTATFDMTWDPGSLASFLCHEFEMHETLSGEVLPFRDELIARVRFLVEDSSIVGRWRVQQDLVPLRADLTEKSWTKIREVLAEQDKLNRCGMFMNPDSAVLILRKFANQGIPIRLPAKIFKSFKLPVTIETVYEAAGYTIEARAYDPAIAMRPNYLRLAFRADLSVRAAARTGRVKNNFAALR